MSSPSDHPTRQNMPAPGAVPAPSTSAAPVRKPPPAPSAPKLAYSELPDPPATQTGRFSRGAGRVAPPKRSATPPVAAPRPVAPRPSGHGHTYSPNAQTQLRPGLPAAPPQRRAPAPRPAQAPARPTQPSRPASRGRQAPPARPIPPQQPAASPPQRTRPRLTTLEWAAAAAMVLLILAVVIGLAL